jgi:DNA-binding NarL/FixJ family response regulator
MQSATAVSSNIAVPVVYPPGKSVLTRRELEVLHLMAEGITTKAIAERLGVTFKTAACHRGRILQKLAVESTVSAVRWAIRQGIVLP